MKKEYKILIIFEETKILRKKLFKNLTYYIEKKLKMLKQNEFEMKQYFILFHFRAKF